MSRRLALIIVGIVAGVAGLTAVVVVGLRQAPESQSATGADTYPLDPAVVRAKLGGAPPPLAALHGRANQLVAGSTGRLQKELAAVKGHPAVVNVWAAWCGPCIVELPVVQRASLDFGRQVAFLGLDYQDNRASAERLLKRIPLTFPSVEDPSAKARSKFKLLGPPTTIFFDRRGKQTFVHSGAYRDRQDFVADLKRYAVGSA